VLTAESLPRSASLFRTSLQAYSVLNHVIVDSAWYPSIQLLLLRQFRQSTTAGPVHAG